MYNSKITVTDPMVKEALSDVSSIIYKYFEEKGKPHLRTQALAALGLEYGKIDMFESTSKSFNETELSTEKNDPNLKRKERGVKNNLIIGEMFLEYYKKNRVLNELMSIFLANDQKLKKMMEKKDKMNMALAEDLKAYFEGDKEKSPEILLENIKAAHQQTEKLFSESTKDIFNNALTNLKNNKVAESIAFFSNFWMAGVNYHPEYISEKRDDLKESSQLLFQLIKENSDYNKFLEKIIHASPSELISLLTPKDNHYINKNINFFPEKEDKINRQLAGRALGFISDICSEINKEKAELKITAEAGQKLDKFLDKINKVRMDNKKSSTSKMP